MVDPKRVVIVIETTAEAFHVNPDAEALAVLQRLCSDWEMQGVTPSILRTRYGEACGRADIRPLKTAIEREQRRLRRQQGQGK